MKNAGMHYSSSNRNVNGGPTRGGGSPKDTKGNGPGPGGSDTGMKATNVITVCGIHSEPYSPNANKVSKNR